jgi:uncharacterized membrane protein
MDWWMAIGIVWMFAFWGIIVGLVVWGVKQFSTNRGEGSYKNGTPIDIARKRLAAEDISKEHFEELEEAQHR